MYLFCCFFFSFVFVCLSFVFVCRNRHEKACLQDQQVNSCRFKEGFASSIVSSNTSHSSSTTTNVRLVDVRLVAVHEESMFSVNCFGFLCWFGNFVFYELYIFALYFDSKDDGQFVDCLYLVDFMVLVDSTIRHQERKVYVFI